MPRSEIDVLIASAAISLFPNGERGPNNWVDRAAFAAAPDTRRGTCGVGTIQGPGAQTWDFSLRRRFWIDREVQAAVPG